MVVALNITFTFGICVWSNTGIRKNYEKWFQKNEQF